MPAEPALYNECFLCLFYFQVGNLPVVQSSHFHQVDHRTGYKIQEASAVRSVYSFSRKDPGKVFLHVRADEPAECSIHPILSNLE